MKIKEAFKKKGYSFLIDSVTNQQFPILSHDKIRILQEKYTFSFWDKVDDNHNVVRFCTCWATKEEDVEELVKDIEKL